MKEKQPQNNNYNILVRYAGMGVQMLAALGIAAYAGLYADRWIKVQFALFVWLLPLIVLIAILVKAVKDTSKNNDG